MSLKTSILTLYEFPYFVVFFLEMIVFYKDEIWLSIAFFFITLNYVSF